MSGRFHRWQDELAAELGTDEPAGENAVPYSDRPAAGLVDLTATDVATKLASFAGWADRPVLVVAATGEVRFAGHWAGKLFSVIVREGQAQ